MGRRVTRSLTALWALHPELRAKEELQAREERFEKLEAQFKKRRKRPAEEIEQEEGEEKDEENQKKQPGLETPKKQKDFDKQKEELEKREAACVAKESVIQAQEAAQKKLAAEQSAKEAAQLAKEAELQSLEQRLKEKEQSLAKSQPAPTQLVTLAAGSVMLDKLSTGSLRYLEIQEAIFSTKGRGFSKKSKTITAIYVYSEAMSGTAINTCMTNFANYVGAGSIATEYRFHGTVSACATFSTTPPPPAHSALSPCRAETCSLCSILRRGFLAARIRTGSFLKFGHGFYTAKNSWLADGYVSPHGGGTHRALIVCKVAIGNVQHLRPGSSEHSRRSPDRGYDSVCGLRKSGSETVVYREDAIIPVGVVVYT
ncbi:hypothetical protein QBC42DRAFT_326237 [Cladorrhinum samala]|uniref:PARP catalytic domain-containing protein n=1 Tax=Cladorrhinum samala TaxID=585594 RepID=A0AAV9I0P1_9PEZI|nr:hypothetical protein QBC42DRAFT_326237 [Cladorrhinum samala]